MNASPINYENAIVTYLDILGFRDIVSKLSADEVSKILKAVEYFNTPPTLSKDSNDLAYKPIIFILSDTIIRVRPLEREDNRKYGVGLLLAEMLDIVHVQGELISFDVILRGAISYGQISVFEKQVFGPALVRSYELENNCAIYPRVIIDPGLLKEFKSNELLRSTFNKYADELEEINEILQKGDDAFWFINYLKIMGDEVDDPYTYLELLEKHKKMIIDKAGGLRLPQNALQKIMWLAKYHNQQVTSINGEWFEQYGYNMNDLLIGEVDIDNLVEFNLRVT
jgi:hypothetical protein